MPVIFTRPGESPGVGLASQVVNDSSVPGLSVKDALEWLESNMASAVYFKMNQPLTVLSGTQIYLLPDTPVSGTQEVYVNGLLTEPGPGNDYTIVGSIITFDVALEVDDILLASYIFNV